MLSRLWRGVSRFPVATPVLAARRVLPLHSLRLRLPAARAFATAGRRQALPAAIPDVDQDLAEQEDDMEAPNSLSDEELEEGIEDGEDSGEVSEGDVAMPTEFEDEEIEDADLAVNLEGLEEPESQSQVPPEITPPEETDLESLLNELQRGKPKNTYPKLSVKEAVLAKYPFRMYLEATVPMKMTRNKEYQYPHFKAKLTVALQDMALPTDVRRVFLELVGPRFEGGLVSFVSREYASVEACEEKVYSLLDQTLTRAKELAAQFRKEDDADSDLKTINQTLHTKEEDPEAAAVRGVLLPYKRKESRVGTRRKALGLLPTGLTFTKLGLARFPAAAKPPAAAAQAAATLAATTAAQSS